MEKLKTKSKRQLSETHIDEFKATFDLFDRDQNGLITKDDLLNMMHTYFRNPSPVDVEFMIARYDRTGKNALNFEEFLEISLEAREDARDNYDRIRKQFAIYDLDGDGYISQTDMQVTFLHLGKDLSKQEVQDIIYAADIDGDGRLNFEEFYNVMTS